MSSLSPILVDKSTGEVIQAATAQALLGVYGLHPLADADTVDLAQFTEDALEVRRVFAEAVGEVSDELVARLDANARWTLRQDGWEIKSQSPAAGSVSYDIDLLREALEELVTDGVISRDAAWNAVEPVRATVEVSYRLLRDVLRALDGYETADGVIAEVEAIMCGEPGPTYKLKLAGVNALLKVPDARESVEACAISVTPPRRTARVKRA